MAKCPFCGQEINNPATYNENRKKMIENGRLALKRIDKIKDENNELRKLLKQQNTIGSVAKHLRKLEHECFIQNPALKNLLFEEIKKNQQEVKNVYKGKIVKYDNVEKNDSFVTFNPNK